MLNGIERDKQSRLLHTVLIPTYLLLLNEQNLYPLPSFVSVREPALLVAPVTTRYQMWGNTELDYRLTQQKRMRKRLHQWRGMY